MAHSTGPLVEEGEAPVASRTVPAPSVRPWVKGAAALGIALVLFAFGYGIVSRELAPAPVAVASRPAVAVMPLINASDDPDDEYFSRGLSDDLIGALGRMRGLDVIGRTSSFRFASRRDDALRIGARLGVDYLVDGSVRKVAGRVRIVVVLVRTLDGANLWSDTYDRESKDLFAAQAEMATAITGQFERLLHIEAPSPASFDVGRPPSGKVEAYEALLQGDDLLRHGAPADAGKAFEFYEQALALDPDYARAHANLAIALVLNPGVIDNASRATKEYVRNRARKASETALRLAPDLAQAHVARALVLEKLDLEPERAEQAYRQAAALAPSDPTVTIRLGDLLLERGNAAAALEAFDRTSALDPLVAPAYHREAGALRALGRLDEAERALKKAIEVEAKATAPAPAPVPAG